jgi:hypothetical protein
MYFLLRYIGLWHCIIIIIIIIIIMYYDFICTCSLFLKYV